MNPFEQYAAQRADLLAKADDRLRPSVTAALDDYGSDGWSDPIINVAETVFAEIYEAERGDPKNFDAALGAFSDALGEALELTTEPSTPVDNAQIERITTWVATLTGSAATAATMGPEHKAVWTSMRDLDVRESHIAADGQVRTVGQRFDVGSAKLRFPGDPDGPLEEILGCRCLLLRDGGTTMAARAFSVTTEEPETQEVDGEDYDVADLPDGEDSDFEYENPRWHGVIAPEGSPSGDGRSFAVDSITTRDLPLPLRWTRADVGQHQGAVVVGNITDVWRDGGLIKAQGNFRTDSPEADEVVGMIATEMLRGVSVDLDDIAFTVDDEVNEMGESPVTLTKGRLSAATLVDIPAFPEVFIALGDWPEGGISEQAAIIASCGCQSLDDTGTHLSLGWGAPSEEIDNGPEFGAGDRVTWDDGESRGAVVSVDGPLALVRAEGGTEDIEIPVVDLAHDDPEEFRNVPAKERKDLADEGKALPDGSFPIANCDDLKNAIQAIGRAKDPAKAKAHIKKRASALSCGDDIIPDTWAGEVETFAPGTKDGPGWLTNPEDTQRLRTYWTKGAGAKKIGWGTPGDFNRCRAQLGKYVNPLFLAGTCANLHKEAIGSWPGREGGGKASANTPSFTLVAAANRVFDHHMFERPVLEDPRVGVWIEDDHVFGYVAQWGVCHIGVQGVCTEAPASATDYWYYATGVVDTDAGQVRVGQITMDTGHSDLSAPLRIAAAHYDNTGSAVADIAVGEDEFGIWFSGVMRSEATESQRHALRAAGRLSGDWRDVRGNLEMVATLAVNVPGFPIPHVALAASGGVQISLVAAGIQAPTEVVNGTDILSLVRTALDQIDYERSRAEKVAAARATLRAARIERARATLRG